MVISHWSPMSPPSKLTIKKSPASPVFYLLPPPELQGESSGSSQRGQLCQCALSGKQAWVTGLAPISVLQEPNQTPPPESQVQCSASEVGPLRGLSVCPGVGRAGRKEGSTGLRPENQALCLQTSLHCVPHRCPPGAQISQEIPEVGSPLCTFPEMMKTTPAPQEHWPQSQESPMEPQSRWPGPKPGGHCYSSQILRA